MKFAVTANWLKQQFKPALNYERLVVELNLDMGHLMLLRDAVNEWSEITEDYLLLLFYLVHTVNSGSLCLYLDDSSLNDFLKQHGRDVSTANDAAWHELTLDGESILAFEDNRLYFKKYWHHEKDLETAVSRLIQNYSGQNFDAQKVNLAAHKVVNDLSFETIEDKQVLAIVTSLLKPFSIISGGPGTGKTTIMGSVLRGLLYLGYQVDDIRLAAPTGRAANRMTESLHAMINNTLHEQNSSDLSLLELEATTLHRLLKTKSYGGQFTYGENKHLPCQVLVVDEVSMVDIKLMKQLIQSVPIDCRVILLGDQFQLPSVSAGAVLADLMPPESMNVGVSQSMLDDLMIALQGFSHKASILPSLKVTLSPQQLTDCFTLLEVSKRSKKNIARCSEMVRKGQFSELMTSPDWQKAQFKSADEISQSEGVYHLPPFKDSYHWQQFYCNWVASFYFSKSHHFINNINYLDGFDEYDMKAYSDTLHDLFEVINHNRILTFVNHGYVGSDSINANVVELMKQGMAVKGFANQFHGSVIMVTQNNAALGLFNGDVAILLRASSGQLRAVFPSKGQFASHSIHVIPEFKSAYAMTVHKSQGSEFNHVLIAMPDDVNHRLLSREILYTGMTRAKKSVLICGAEHVIKTAIKNKSQRHSGLRFWYN